MVLVQCYAGVPLLNRLELVSKSLAATYLLAVGVDFWRDLALSFVQQLQVRLVDMDPVLQGF